MTVFYILIAFFLFLGAWLCWAGLRRVWRRRPMTGSMQGLTGLLFLACAALFIAIAINLYTYQVFNQEQPVAEVRFEALGPQYFRVYLIPEGSSSRVLELRGDEWQLDTRILKWHGLANLLGMKTSYRLERISGRYHDVQQERSAVRTVHELEDTRGLDLWLLANEHKKKIPWLDAVYGSAAYVPMVDKGIFRASMSHTGLVVRADNGIAQRAIENWR
jgi:hypothetical protein